MKSALHRRHGMRGWPMGIAMIAITLSACGEKPQQPATPQVAPVKLFQEERTALDKAKGVESTTNKGSEELRQDVEQQTK